MKAWAASLAVLLASGAAQAATPPPVANRLAVIDNAYDRCVVAAKTNTEFGLCGGQRLKADDQLLNDLWKRVYAASRGSAKTALLAEQRLWITYKDKSCSWWLYGQGREGQVLHYPICRSTIIEDRVRLLDSLGTGAP
jgi:uncharacterized protein YecT (DUF1311 family)